MNSILKISEAAAMALHVMGLLAARPGEVQPTRQMAEELRVSEAHLSKVLQRLARVGLVRSVRGAHGGFLLVAEPETVSVLDVYEAIDGRLRPSSCLLGQQKSCEGGPCILGDLLDELNAQVTGHFETRTLADLAGPFRKEDGDEAIDRAHR